MHDDDEISGMVVDEAFKLHKDIGPGLLESVYTTLLAHRLRKRGLAVETEKVVALVYDGIRFDQGFRLDLLVEGRVVVELKSVEQVPPVAYKQTLTYLRILDLRVGLLINFGAELFKHGVRRIVN
ncbi:MAG: GxxExxY protein [Flavobacteriales bacterium]|nr:MAG: GxxExxY protein [Flavobacteriales bacterium]